MFCSSNVSALASHQNVWGSNPQMSVGGKVKKVFANQKQINMADSPMKLQSFLFHTSSEGFSPNPYRISNKTQVTKVQGSNFSKIKKKCFTFS